MDNPILQCTLQVFALDKKNQNSVVPIGSALLFRDSGSHFILTAKHLMKELSNHYPCVFVNNTLEIIVGEWRFFVLDNKYDNIDIAVLKIENQIALTLLKQYKALTKNNFYLDHKFSNDNIFLVSGFPVKQTVAKNKVFHIQPFAFITQEISLRKLNKISLNQNENIIVRYRRKDQSFLNDNFKSHGPQDLRGISGCGLWIFNSKSDISNPIHLKLAGIVIEADINRSIICATKSILLLQLIFQGFRRII